MLIEAVRHKWHEKNNFSIIRPQGSACYVLVSFYNEADFLLDGKKVPLKTGGTVLYNIHTPQNWTSRGSLCHDWIHFGEEFGVYAKKYGLKFDTVLYPTNIQRIRDTVQEMEKEFFGISPFREEMLENLCQKLCIELSRGSNPGYENEEQHLFTNLRISVHASLQEQWNVKKMAKAVSLSESRFYALYKAIFKISPTEDLICAKMDKAKYYLSDTNLNINSISVALGYRHTTHFCRQFKERCGVSPGEYRAGDSTRNTAG